MSVNDSIRTIRKIKQWTQEDMAEKLEMSVNAYSKIESGKTKLNLDKLEQIANIFNINVAELVESKEKGFIFLFSENNQNNSTIYTSEAAYFEIEKLKFMLEQKEKEIQLLKDVIELLKNR